MFEKIEKRFGTALIFIGIALLATNSFLYFFNEPSTDMGKAMLSSIGGDTKILIFASIASWVIPLFLVLLGITIVKRSIKKNEI